MALTASNVRVAVTGGIYFADSGTDLPEDATESLAVAFGELGYASSDGITQSIASDTTTIQAWQNGDTVRTLETTHDLTYAVTLIETSAATLEAYYGNYAAGAVEVKATQGIRGSWVFNVIDGDHRIRVVVPDGQVTERGDVQWVNGEAVSYPITISCYPDESAVKAYIYLDDGSGS